jgi:hypothetical protein
MRSSGKIAGIGAELGRHMPFTALGTLSGILIMGLIALLSVPAQTSERLFWVMHPAHVLLSALVTTAVYRLHSGRGFMKTLLVGYLGSVGIATFSDSVMPYFGEFILGLPRREWHIGFIEKWWLVNPLALAGIGLGAWQPQTRIFHGMHVLLSTWASLFHMTMAVGPDPGAAMIAGIAFFLFLSVWVPCCTSDIVFPLVFAPLPGKPEDSKVGIEKKR